MEPAQVAADSEVIAKLGILAQEWINTVAGALGKEQKKVPVGNGPLAEIEFWKDRSSSLSTLYEQLNLPIVHKIVQTLNIANAATSFPLEFQLSELNKFYAEAKDNVKFLSTFERNFKHLVIGSLSSVEDSLILLLLHHLIRILKIKKIIWERMQKTKTQTTPSSRNVPSTFNLVKIDKQMKSGE